MRVTALGLLVVVGPAVCAVCADAPVAWWNAQWRCRVAWDALAPVRALGRPVLEAEIDFQALLRKAGLEGEFDPATLRVIERDAMGRSMRETPFAYRRSAEPWLHWFSNPDNSGLCRYHIYFDTKGRGIAAPQYAARDLPPQNLLVNAGFEELDKGRPRAWSLSHPACFALERFRHTTGERSLKVFVNERNETGAPAELACSQTFDVTEYQGQEALFQCDLFLAQGRYGLPVQIDLRQYRQDGSPIPERVVQPRWLTIELAEGQLVQFNERGRLNPEAAKVTLALRVRWTLTDADTRQPVAGEESHFTLFADRMVVRPGERWPWPRRATDDFAPGALDAAPFNRGLRVTGERRLMFTGRSQATRTTYKYNPDPRSLHWGCGKGTLEFWLQPSWDAADTQDRVLFFGGYYGNRTMSRLRKTRGSRLEWTLVDGDGKSRKVTGRAPFRKGQWHHVAVTWDLDRAHLQLFFDGRHIGSAGPGPQPWTYRIDGKAKGSEGHGIDASNRPTMPLQACIGNHPYATARTCAEGVFDEFRISDCVRYEADFAPRRTEFPLDANTRALFHFENDTDGAHDSDDRFVKGFWISELPRQRSTVTLEVLHGERVDRRLVQILPTPDKDQWLRNRARARLPVDRAKRRFPDLSVTDHRRKSRSVVLGRKEETFVIDVAGDYAPLMRSVTFEHADPNSGEPALLPHLGVGAQEMPFSAEEVRGTVAPGVTDPADKAFHVFRYACRVTNYYDNPCHETMGGRERRVSYTFLKALNLYPYDQCGPLNHCLRKLFLTCGVSSNQFSGTGHSFEQAFYEGQWRLFDMSPRLYFLGRDEHSVLGLRGIEDDPYQVVRNKRVTPYLPARMSGAPFGGRTRYHSMDFRLHPGENARFCWGNEGRWFNVGPGRQPLGLRVIPPHYANGSVVFQPRAAAHLPGSENLLIETAGARTVWRQANGAKDARAVYRFGCPYILGGCSVSASAVRGHVTMAVSFDDGRSWKAFGEDVIAHGGPLALDLSQDVKGRYAYWLRVTLGEGGEIEDPCVRSVFVLAPLSLPWRLALGQNAVTSASRVTGPAVRTTWQWTERHRARTALSLNALSYYTMEEDSHLNLFAAAPGAEFPVQVTAEASARPDRITIEGLPKGWTARKSPRKAGAFLIRTSAEPERAIPRALRVRWFDVVARQGHEERRIRAQVLVARCPLFREAEAADRQQDVEIIEGSDVSQGRAVRLAKEGWIEYDFRVPRAGPHILWLRQRPREGVPTGLKFALDGQKPRTFRGRAKMFVHYGERYGFWQWYSMSGIELAAGAHRLRIRHPAGGAEIDAAVMLPQTQALERAASNLFHNWLYMPWED